MFKKYKKAIIAVSIILGIIILIDISLGGYFPTNPIIMKIHKVAGAIYMMLGGIIFFSFFGASIYLLSRFESMYRKEETKNEDILNSEKLKKIASAKELYGDKLSDEEIYKIVEGQSLSKKKKGLFGR